MLFSILLTNFAWSRIQLTRLHDPIHPFATSVVRVGSYNSPIHCRLCVHFSRSDGGHFDSPTSNPLSESPRSLFSQFQGLQNPRVSFEAFWVHFKSSQLWAPEASGLCKKRGREDRWRRDFLQWLCSFLDSIKVCASIGIHFLYIYFFSFCFMVVIVYVTVHLGCAYVSWIPYVLF